MQDALFEAYRKLDQYDDSLTWRFVISRQASRFTNVLSKGTGLPKPCMGTSIVSLM